jgi:hypothetical protein
MQSTHEENFVPEFSLYGKVNNSPRMVVEQKIKFILVGVQVLTATRMKMAFFWDTAPFKLVDTN